MKRKSASFLAGVLVASMVATPLSYTNAYAEDQDGVLAESAVVQQETEEISGSETGDTQETTPVKEEEKTETKEEETVMPAQPETGETEKNDNTKPKNSNKQSASNQGQNNQLNEIEDQEKAMQSASSQEAMAQQTEVPVQPTVAIDGVKVLKKDGANYAEYGMFPIVVEKMEVTGGQIKIDFNTGTKKTFDRIYLGQVTDTDKSSYIQGTNTGSTCKFSISVPLSKKNSWIPVSVGYVKDGTDTWSKNYLWMSIPDLQAPVITSQPQSVEKKTGEQVSLSVEADGTDYSYQWQYSTDGTNWTDCTDLSAKTSTYTFEMAADKIGQYRCVISNSKGTMVTSGVAKVEKPSAPTVTGEQVQVVNGDGIAFSMFKISESKVQENGENLEVTFSTSDKNYDKIYLGEKEDALKTPIIKGKEAGNGYTFTFKVPLSDKGKSTPVVLGKADGSWYNNQDLWIYIPEKNSSTDPTPDPNPTPNPGAVVPADGIYKVNNVECSASMFRVVGCTLTVRNGKMSAVLTLSGTGYGYLYMGTKEEAAAADQSTWIPFKTDSEGKYTYTVPVESLDKEIAVAGYSTKNKIWYDRTLIFHSDSLEKVGNLPALENGIYSIDVDSSASMFRVVDCKLTSKDGKMSAVLTLSGTGYDYLYVGTKEDAAKADKSSWVPFKEDSNGKYTYTIPVEALDKEIAVAAFSHKNQIWYDRLLTFKSETVKKISDLSDDNNGNGNNSGNSGTNGGNTKPSGGKNDALKPNDGKAENESKYETDTSGATSQVNSSTTLADGVYTPDRFTWSGGTGKVKIYCNKITIRNGQAYATLVFDSDHYQYVKANGNTYYTTKGGGTATVTIPVALNQNNKILGMTDKMSVAHEIEYTIFVYLAAAGNGTTLGGVNASKKLDEKAPDIMGLEYQSETKLDYAEYFKIYYYDQGITLLEIDMTKGTANDPEKLAAEAINAENETGESEDAAKDTESDQSTNSKDVKSENAAEEDTTAVGISEDGEENLNGISEEELAAELYKGNVVKYLLVPEGVEVPVGLDQDMIVVQMPVDKTYTSTEAILEKMDELGLTDNVVAIGDKKKDCKVDSVVEKMEKKDGEEKAQVVYGGKEDDPDYKTLVKQETNLALLSSDILPKEADITDLEENQDKAESKDTDKKSDEKKKDKSDKKSDKKTNEKSKKKAENQKELTVEEQTERFQQMTEKFALLGIPVIVDRSEDEQTDIAKYEWIKVYGVLFGCEDQMNTLFDQAVKDAGDDAIAQARVQTEK